VVDTNKFDRKAVAKLHTFVRLGVEHVVVGLVAADRLLHSSLDHTKGKLAGIDGRRDTVNKMTEGADMVKVAVSEDMTADFMLVFL
jgi:hypothetical protein